MPIAATKNIIKNRINLLKVSKYYLSVLYLWISQHILLLQKWPVGPAVLRLKKHHHQIFEIHSFKKKRYLRPILKFQPNQLAPRNPTEDTAELEPTRKTLHEPVHM